MHCLKKILTAAVILFLAGCSSKAANPLPKTVYYFPSRPSQAAPSQQILSTADPEEGMKSLVEACRRGDYETALLLAASLAEQFPGTPWHGRALFITEQALVGLDRAPEAKAAMLRVKAEFPILADYAVSMLADYHFSRERFVEAAALYRDVTEQYPSSSLAVRSAYRRAQALLGASLFAEAAELLEAFVRNNPRSEFSGEAGLALGNALAAGNRTELAVQAYRDVWSSHPGTAAEQAAANALSELSAQGVRVAPWTGDEWYERGRNLFRLMQYEKSALSFKKMLETEPSSAKRPDALFRIGVALYRCGKRGDAASALETMIKEYPRDQRVPEALYWAGRSYSRLGEREKAVRTLSRIVEKFTRSEWADEALFMIGNIYRDADDAEAFAVYSRLASDYPESRFSDSALWWNAWSCYRRSEFGKAEQILQTLIDRYPRSFLVHQARYWQGRAAEKTGKADKAADYYGKVLKRGRYTYYGYRAADRLAAAPAVPVPVAEADVPPDDVIAAECDEEDCLEGQPAADRDEGPPVWTEETKRLLANESSFRKSLELMHLDMRKEAAAELWYLHGKMPRKRGSLIGLSKAFFELGDYYRSLLLVLRNYERYLDGQVRDIPSDLWLLAYPQGYWDTILSWSRKYGQDPYFVAAIIRQESMFHAAALSPAGARGVMQVMPATGEWIAQSIKLHDFERVKLFESDTAINLGTWYVHHLMKRFNGDPLLTAAAYNAGPEAVASWISKNSGVLDRDEFLESIPFLETRNYVKKVLRNYYEYRRIYTTQGQPRAQEVRADRTVQSRIDAGQAVETP